MDNADKHTDTRAQSLQIEGKAEASNISGSINAGVYVNNLNTALQGSPGFDLVAYKNGLLNRYSRLRLESLDTAGTIHYPVLLHLI